jgi:hypothetical protein
MRRGLLRGGVDRRCGVDRCGSIDRRQSGIRR